MDVDSIVTRAYFGMSCVSSDDVAFLCCNFFKYFAYRALEEYGRYIISGCSGACIEDFIAVIAKNICAEKGDTCDFACIASMISDEVNEMAYTSCDDIDIVNVNCENLFI